MLCRTFLHTYYHFYGHKEEGKHHIFSFEIHERAPKGEQVEKMCVNPTLHSGGIPYQR